MITTYKGTITREGKWWMIEIPEIDGLTQARRLDDAEQSARELIAVDRDVPLSQVAVDLTIEPINGAPISEYVAQIRQDKTTAAKAERRAVQSSTDLSRILAAAGVPQRDIATLLGVSFQRVAQLLAS